MDKLFEPFFTTKEVGVGSGLGLPISNEIVESYHGTIAVQSTPGKGTTVTVRIPACVAKEAPASTPGVTTAGNKVRGRVLIVDDEDPIRAAIARVLRKHETIEAKTATEARRILEDDQAFDLVLCDMMMPDGSGMDLHQWLAASHPRLAARFVFVTGGAFTPRAREYLRRVDNPTIAKPFEVSHVERVVDELIRGAKAL
jgi:CheY-like chemotaxis protein